MPKQKTYVVFVTTLELVKVLLWKYSEILNLFKSQVKIFALVVFVCQLRKYMYEKDFASTSKIYTSQLY